MMKIFFVLELVFCTSLAGVAQTHRPASIHSQRHCTEQEERRALDECDKIRTWNEIYRSFKRFAHCADGAIAEGYSDKVVGLLAHDWKDFLTAAHLMSLDPRFKTFVIRHVDETAAAEDLTAIKRNVSVECPKSDSGLCKAIGNKIAELQP
jgi:hypothetical protein